MKRKFQRYLMACLPVFFIFICSLTQAQSKSVKEVLGNADRLYAQEKYEEARTLYLQHAVYLSSAQQINLGVVCMATSKEKPERGSEAITWFEKAASAGNTEAMNTLSFCYSKGIGVAKDLEKELHWLSRSADNGNENALVVLGNRYEIGLGVEKNTTKAAELYTKAANKGNAQAAFNLGALEGYENPSLSARYWLKKSADGNYLPAMLKLGEIYENEKDPDEAVRWYTKIAGIKGYTAEHKVAADRKWAIGRLEPSTDINTVKPLLKKMIGLAANNYNGLLGQEKVPLTGKRVDGFSESTYYTSTLDLGFKNALIRKEVVKARDLGEFKIQAGTHYSYSADIVYSVKEETALRVFEKWVTVLKAIIPEWESSKSEAGNRRPSFTVSGNMTNGKKVVISISVYGLDSENVGFSISNR